MILIRSISFGSGIGCVWLKLDWPTVSCEKIKQKTIVLLTILGTSRDRLRRGSEGKWPPTHPQRPSPRQKNQMTIGKNKLSL